MALMIISKLLIAYYCKIIIIWEQNSLCWIKFYNDFVPTKKGRYKYIIIFLMISAATIIFVCPNVKKINIRLSRSQNNTNLKSTATYSIR